jgi:solute:Na+ symporter, SSS family
MDTSSVFALHFWDYAAFVGYFVVICGVGLWAGRKKKADSADYFLAGRTLPWYVVGSSFIASNISTEHFIGMIGAAFVFGIAPAYYEWGNVAVFTLMIWLFIPYLLASRVFTTPEYMERRFNPLLRQFFAIVTIISNVVAFLAAVLYGGGLALQNLFGWNLWFAIIILAVVAGSWAIYGGLKSVAWTDFVTVLVMLAGGLMVTVLGLYDLSGDSNSLSEGMKVMIERNQAETGVWREAVEQNAQEIVGRDEYDRLAILQPTSHALTPWPMLFFGVFSISIWYSVCNQFMIQRVLGAKNGYHARMGIVLAGFMKVFLPLIIVVPGLILFAKRPEVMLLPWAEIQPEADKGYVHMLQSLVPIGLRGLFLAALFGAIQSTINSVLNSTATIFTLDIYKRLLRTDASEKRLVVMGMVSSVVILAIAVVLAGFIERLGSGLFTYIQSLYAFFAPPFGSVFLLGILFRRINGKGATAGVFAGFALGLAMKIFVQFAPDPPAWIVPFGMQAIINWFCCSAVCVAVSLATPPPDPEQVSDNLTFNWRKLNLFTELGDRWYTSVVFWWALFVVVTIALFVVFSGIFL